MCHRSTRQRSCCNTARAKARYGCCWRAHNSRSHRSCLLVLSLPPSLSPSSLLAPCSARLDSSEVSSVCLNNLVLSPTPPALPSPLACGASLYTCFVSLSLLLPQLVGVSWRLDYVVKSKHLDHVNRPLYILRFLCIARDGSEVLHTREMGVCVGGGGSVVCLHTLAWLSSAFTRSHSAASCE